MVLCQLYTVHSQTNVYMQKYHACLYCTRTLSALLPRVQDSRQDMSMHHTPSTQCFVNGLAHTHPWLAQLQLRLAHRAGRWQDTCAGHLTAEHGVCAGQEPAVHTLKMESVLHTVAAQARKLSSAPVCMHAIEVLRVQSTCTFVSVRIPSFPGQKRGRKVCTYVGLC